jgi:hypothetical protein
VLARLFFGFGLHSARKRAECKRKNALHLQPHFHPHFSCRRTRLKRSLALKNGCEVSAAPQWNGQGSLALLSDFSLVGVTKK